MLTSPSQNNDTIVAQDPFSPQVDSEKGSSLEPIALTDIPHDHPVRLFADIYTAHLRGNFLPDENELVRSADALPLFAWGKHIEPVEIDGGVDFKVLRIGERNALRERRTYRDQWMCDTLDHEFVQAQYREIIAAAVLRKPRFSKGSTPCRERSFLYCLRGVFPVFAENHARMRLFQIEAEPYVSV